MHLKTYPRVNNVERTFRGLYPIILTHIHKVRRVNKMQPLIYLKGGLLAIPGNTDRMRILQIHIAWDGIPREMSVTLHDPTMTF